MDPTCLWLLIYAGLLAYAVFATWRWRVAARERDEARAKAKDKPR